MDGQENIVSKLKKIIAQAEESFDNTVSKATFLSRDDLERSKKLATKYIATNTILKLKQRANEDPYNYSTKKYDVMLELLDDILK